MVSMTANGTLWPEARPGSSVVYDSLVNGWEKWNANHTDDTTITESDYPHVSFFDTCVNPPALRRILLTMLNPNPQKRISMKEVLKNRWFKNVECCQLDTFADPTTDEVIDASKKGAYGKSAKKVGNHNHLPPVTHHGHRLVRLPGNTDIW